MYLETILTNSLGFEVTLGINMVRSLNLGVEREIIIPYRKKAA
jgi:hypothetical protein